MPTTCCVRGCKSRGGSSDENVKIKYFRFPKDEVRRQLWVKAICREGFVPTNNSMVCNAHFTTEDFQKRPDLIKLTDNAIPSVFNCPVNVKRSRRKKVDLTLDLKSSKKSAKKHIDDYLWDHTYVLRLPEEEMSLEKSIDPSTYMIQTLKVDDNIIDEPQALNLSMPNKTTLKNIKFTSEMIEKSCFNILNGVRKPFQNSEEYWREVTVVQSDTIINLRKKIKILQQKIRRHTLKIETLKNQLELVYQNLL